MLSPKLLCNLLGGHCTPASALFSRPGFVVFRNSPFAIRHPSAVLLLLLCWFLSLVPGNAGTVVRFRTALGDIQVQLYDADKPVTVQNFLRYVQNGLYANMIMHRVVTNWVVQGGGLMVTNRGTTNQTLAYISTYLPITNEFNVGRFHSNVYGTLAMAKTSDPNSATAQFFFNLADNSASLDDTNNSGGFTVFGRVVSDTNILNRFNPGPANTFINQLNLGGMLAELPVLKPATAATVTAADLLYVEVSVVLSPTFIVQPQSLTNLVGGTVTFATSTGGNEPISLQWIFNGHALSGFTNNSLIITNAQAPNEGNYFVVASNGYGVATSIVATLTLTNSPTRPTILQQPQSQVLRPGQPAQFQVVATGSEPLRYRWTKDGITVPGASNAVYTVNTVSTTDTGNYQVILTNISGSVTSEVAVLTVDGVLPISAITSPLTESMVTNSLVVVVGTAWDNHSIAAVHYQLNDGPWLVAVGTTNWQAAITLNLGTNYVLAFSLDAAGNASKTNAISILRVLADTLTVQTTGLGRVSPDLNNQSLGVGMRFEVTAVPSQGYMLSNWMEQVGGGAATVVATTANYTFVMKSNLVLTANFAPTAKPVIVQQPTSMAVQPGQSVQFQVQATGSAPLRYRWTKDGITVPGASNAVYTVNTVSTTDTGNYQVILTNISGSVTSEVAVLTVDGVLPISAITSPLTESMVTNSLVVVVGTAWDNHSIAAVHYQLNDGPWLVAVGTTNWQAAITLNLGTNYVLAFSLDAAGNASKTNAISILRVLADTLTVQTTGLGRVSPDLNNQSLGVGMRFEVTAVPSQGYMLSNWMEQVGGGAATVVATTANYTFVMKSNLVLTANFAPTAKPVIVQQPTSMAVQPGQSVQFQVQATGSAPLRYRWTKDGITVPGASNAVYTINNVSAIHAGKYQVIVANTLGSVTSTPPAILTVDGAKPSLTISKPMPNARVGSSIQVTGRITDAGGPLAVVYYQLNDGQWQTANGTTNWQASVNDLLPSTNTIKLYAVDMAGNFSLTNLLKVNYVVNTLRVGYGGNGYGKVTPSTNTMQDAGKNYPLTATPLTGSIFSNWMCGDMVLTNKPVLQFTLRSNTTLVANFMANTFLARKGDYYGLFCPSNDVSLADWTNSGAVKLTV
ncbi:MAG: immunoglobulin domain-containing protein, partial [Verrucomicrobiota bacterium]